METATAPQDQVKYLLEVENAIVDVLRPYRGQEINEDLIGEIVNSLYNGIRVTGLKANVAGYTEHIDLNIQHPDDASLFEANIKLELNGIADPSNGNNRETATKTD